MKTTLVAAAAFLVLAVPAALAVPPVGHGNQGSNGQGGAAGTDSSASTNPAMACKAERTQLGVDAFNAKYGTNANKKNAFGKCVSQTQIQIGQAEKNAAKTCKAERASLGVDAFNAKYGTNANKKNAFGKCVSQKAQQQISAEQHAEANAAKTCKAERTQLGVDAFNAKYGTNANKKNAFGKCVSQHAKAKGSDSD
jgi:hypothetical protein